MLNSTCFAIAVRLGAHPWPESPSSLSAAHPYPSFLRVGPAAATPCGAARYPFGVFAGHLSPHSFAACVLRHACALSGGCLRNNVAHKKVVKTETHFNAI